MGGGGREIHQEQKNMKRGENEAKNETENWRSPRFKWCDSADPPAAIDPLGRLSMLRMSWLNSGRNRLKGNGPGVHTRADGDERVE